ncbi:hypothetical protein GGS21DRAFT_486252 [Xylaria nigripes]|nr:hypothetical protein GGS21DRAFT_486252 [Xylaria nigripes]
MPNFSSAKYRAERGVAVSPSLRWGDAYHHLDRNNVTVGDRIRQVDVGRLILRGGCLLLLVSIFEAKELLSSFHIVLADGSVLDANRRSHTDLRWTLIMVVQNNVGTKVAFVGAAGVEETPLTHSAGNRDKAHPDDLPDRGRLGCLKNDSMKYPCGNLMIQVFLINGTLGVLLNMVQVPPVSTADQLYAASFETDATLFKEVQQIVATSPEVDTIRNLTAGSIAVGWQSISTSAIGAGHARGGNALDLKYVN